MGGIFLGGLWLCAFFLFCWAVVVWTKTLRKLWLRWETIVSSQALAGALAEGNEGSSFVRWKHCFWNSVPLSRREAFYDKNDSVDTNELCNSMPSRSPWSWENRELDSSGSICLGGGPSSLLEKGCHCVGVFGEWLNWNSHSWMRSWLREDMDVVKVNCFKEELQMVCNSSHNWQKLLSM